MTSRLRIRVARRAARHISDAAEWWVANRPGAPELFRDQLSRAFDLVLKHPGIGARATNVRLAGVRRVHLSRVRYHLYYRVHPESSEVEVLAMGCVRRTIRGSSSLWCGHGGLLPVDRLPRPKPSVVMDLEELFLPIEREVLADRPHPYLEATFERKILAHAGNNDGRPTDGKVKELLILRQEDEIVGAQPLPNHLIRSTAQSEQMTCSTS